MSLPINLDEYTKYITMTDDELCMINANKIILERIHRLRGLYSYWIKFPDKFDKDIVNYDVLMFKVGKSQAYDDIRLVQILLGSIQQANKDFMRWKINKDLEEDLKRARRAGDMRSVAQIEKNRILNNRTDKDDEPEFEFKKIVPQQFAPTDDPSVIGIKKIPDLRAKIKKLNKKYSQDNIQEAEYEEIEDDGESE